MSTLAAGTRLGPYEILARIGAGGMGEVYRARDTRLDRSVAVKVLPAAISANPEARARFEREARAISTLNDPHICTLHDVGSEGDTAYLVMELLEGETLADVLARGKLPLDRALRYGIEIATALDRAHRQGIVHRDLKPGNIMITRAGVKLLDFGLARTHNEPRGHDAPTVVSPITSEGTILGTLQYMAPEQLEGKPADARADLFALGCILYEMITGQRAFSGSSQASIITAIMTSDPPPLSSRVPLTPPALERVVRQCLQKSPDDRWQNAGDLATELRWILETPEGATAVRSRTSRLPWIVALVGLGFAAAAATWMLTRRATAATPLRLTLPIVADQFALSELQPDLVVSPDGRYIVYSAVKGATYSLWLRDLRAGTAAPIPNTTGAAAPFWSPDSQQIGFIRGGKLMRAAITGEDAATICDVLRGSYLHATWGHDGTIVFTYLGQRGKMLRVPAAGGTPVDIAPKPVPPQTTFAWPSFIGKSDRLIYCTVQRGADLRLHTTSLGSGQHIDLGPIESRVEIVDDSMLWVRDGALYTQRVDGDLKRVGAPAVLQTGVRNYASIGSATFSASSGLLALAGSETDARATWFDRGGKVLGTIGPNGAQGAARVSRDGRKLIVTARDPIPGTTDLWLCDLTRKTAARITNTPLGEGYPVWSPDDQSLAYNYEEGGPPHIYTQRVTGGERVQITPSHAIQYMNDWTPDGKLLFFSELNSATRRDLWTVAPQPNATPKPWLQTPFYEAGARVSRDGKWVAFVSDASGRREVYISPIEDPGARIQVSTEGGEMPAWRRDGRELFFRRELDVYAVDVRLSPTLETGVPRRLFGEPGTANWGGFDVHPDGQSFVITRTVSGAQTNPFNVIVNWKTLAEKK